MLQRAKRVSLKTKEGVTAWLLAKDQLKANKKTTALKWSDGLALAAEDHCSDIGGKGTFVHQGSDGSQPWDRIKRYGKWTGSVGENMSFGNNKKHGGDFALNLFIDDGVASRGHRKYMLNSDFRYTGIAYCQHHSSMEGMVVIVYAKSFEVNEAG